MVDTFLNFALDPNLLYIALVLGLWLGVTGTILAGTGIVELSAFALLSGSIIGLFNMPTNWLGVAFVVIGVAAFSIMPLLRYGKYAEIGLIFQGIGGALMFYDMRVSPLVIGASLLLALLYHRGVLVPVMREQKTPTAYDESNEVVGYVGRVVKRLDPVGTVYVNREMWRARADETLEVDASVVVVAQRGLELEVQKAKREDRIDTQNGVHTHKAPF